MEISIDFLNLLKILFFFIGLVSLIVYVFTKWIYINKIINLISEVLYLAFIKRIQSHKVREKVSNRIGRVLDLTLQSIFTFFVMFREILKLFFSNPLILFLLALGWFKFVTINLANINEVVVYLDFVDIDDHFTLTTLNAINNMFRLLILVSLPFYYFTYREQKDISESSLNSKRQNTFVLLFLLFAITTVIYSLRIISEFEEAKIGVNSPLAITNDFSNELGLISVYGGIGLFFVIMSIKELYNNISIKQLIQKKIKRTFFNVTLLSFTRTEILRSNIYTQLTYLVESVYQTLIRSAESGLGDMYKKNYKQWRQLLRYFLISNRMGYLDSNSIHMYLLRNGSKHLSLYKTILKNHLVLIIKLVEEHRIEDAKEAINEFLIYIPRPSSSNGYEKEEYYDKYLSTYYVIFYELCMFLYDNKYIGIYSVLERMKSEIDSVNDVEQEGIMRNFVALIIKAIESNDVKKLSAFSYYLTEFFPDNQYDVSNLEEFSSKSQEEHLTYTEVASNVSQETSSFSNLEDIRLDDIDQYDFEEESSESFFTNNNSYSKASIFVLLQALGKSIELSHYKCIGFLVKYLVTNYHAQSLDKAYSELLNNMEKNIYLPINDYYNKIDNNFHFNEKVERYILIKLSILLYGHQKYIRAHNVDFNIIPSKTIDLTWVFQANHLGYSFDKVLKAKGEYGLLCLNDDSFVNELKRDLRLEGNSKKTIKWGTLIKKIIEQF